jgi:hypothetical protein
LSNEVIVEGKSIAWLKWQQANALMIVVKPVGCIDTIPLIHETHSKENHLPRTNGRGDAS